MQDILSSKAYANAYYFTKTKILWRLYTFTQASGELMRLTRSQERQNEYQEFFDQYILPHREENKSLNHFDYARFNLDVHNQTKRSVETLYPEWWSQSPFSTSYIKKIKMREQEAAQVQGEKVAICHGEVNGLRDAADTIMRHHYLNLIFTRYPHLRMPSVEIEKNNERKNEVPDFDSIQEMYLHACHIGKLKQLFKYQVFLQASNEDWDPDLKMTRRWNFLEFSDRHVTPYVQKFPSLKTFNMNRYHAHVNHSADQPIQGLIQKWQETGPLSHDAQNKAHKSYLSILQQPNMLGWKRVDLLGKYEGFKQAKQLILHDPMLPILQQRHSDLLSPYESQPSCI